MSILKRFSNLMASRKGTDKKYDKEVNQILRSLQDEVDKIKVAAAKMEGEETRINRELGEYKEEIKKMTNYIERATKAGNEEDTRIFVSKKRNLEEKVKLLDSTYDRILNRSIKIKQIQDQLLVQMTEVWNQKDSIDMQIEKAKVQETINELNSAMFFQMEERANRMVDEAEAMAELNELERGI